MFLFSRVTLYGYYRKWYWSVCERKGSIKEASYSRLRIAWLSFIELLNVPDTSFSCSECQQNPRVVICDGITLAFQKKHRFANTSNNATTATPKLEGIKYDFVLSSMFK